MASSVLDVLIRVKDQASSALNKIKKSAKAADDALDDVGEAPKSGGSKSREEQLKKIRKELDAVRAAGEKTNQTLDTFRNAGLAIAGLGGALAAPFLIGIRAAARFSVEVAEVATLVDSATVSNEELRKTIIDLSNEFGTSRSEIASGLYQAISSGAAAGAEANEVLRVALLTARGGVTSVRSAVDGLSTILNAFGVEARDAEQVADALFVTVKNGRTTIDELSRFLFQAAPIASQLGVSYQEVNAALVTLTKQGVPTRVAFTQIRSAIVGLIRDTPELNEIFDDLGGAQKAVKDLGLPKVFDILRKATKGNVGELIKLVGSIEGVGAVLGLSGDQLEEFVEQLRQQNEASGDAKEAADKVEEAFGTRLEQAVERVGNAFERLGTIIVPIVGPIVDLVGQLAVDLQDLADNPVGEFFLTLAAGVGAFLLAAGSLAATLAVLSRGFFFLRRGVDSAKLGMQGLAATSKTAAGALGAVRVALNLALPVLGIVTAAITFFAAQSAFASEEVQSLTDKLAGLRAGFDNLSSFKQIIQVAEIEADIADLEKKIADAEAALEEGPGLLSSLLGDPKEATDLLIANLDIWRADLLDAQATAEGFAKSLEVTSTNVLAKDAEKYKREIEDAGVALAAANEAQRELRERIEAPIEISDSDIAARGSTQGLTFDSETGKTFLEIQGEITANEEKELANSQKRIDNLNLGVALSAQRLSQALILQQLADANADSEKAAAEAAAQRLIDNAAAVKILGQEVRSVQQAGGNELAELRARNRAIDQLQQQEVESGKRTQRELLEARKARLEEEFRLEAENLQKVLAATIAAEEAKVRVLQEKFDQRDPSVTQAQIDVAAEQARVRIEALRSQLRQLAVTAGAGFAQAANEIAATGLQGITDAVDKQINDLKLRQEALRREFETGTISRTEFADEIKRITDETNSSLREQLVLLQDLLVTAGGSNAAIEEAITKVREGIDATDTALGAFEQGLRLATEGALADFFEEILTNVDNVGEAFDRLIQSIGDSIKRLIAQKLANKLIGSLFGEKSVLGSLFSGGGEAQGAAGGGFVKAKNGGLLKLAGGGGGVHGPGTATSDSIPALLSDGEYVMQAKSVDRYGLNAMEAINRGLATHIATPRRRLSVTRPKRTRFAEGGIVGSPPNAAQLLAGAGAAGQAASVVATPTELVLNVPENTLNTMMRDVLEREFGRILATR